MGPLDNSNAGRWTPCGDAADRGPRPYEIVGSFYIKAMPAGSLHPGDGAGLILYRAQRANQNEVFLMYDEIAATVGTGCLYRATQAACWPEQQGFVVPRSGEIVGVYIAAPADGQAIAAAMGRALYYTGTPIEIPTSVVPLSPNALEALIGIIYQAHARRSLPAQPERVWRLMAPAGQLAAA